VRAETEGFVGSVLSREGTLCAGDLLAVMRDIDLEQKRDSLRSQIALLGRNALTQRAQVIRRSRFKANSNALS